ncbi:MAG: PEP-CTERM sorting domain-containing protein [Polyangiales bacterium]
MKNRTLLILLAIYFLVMVGVARSDVHVIGDSLSRTPEPGVPWPVVAFGESVDNHAIGGASSFDFIDFCDGPFGCFWAQGEPDDTFLILIGHNDFQDVPDWQPADYTNNILTMADTIEFYSGSTNIGIISSPYVWPRFGDNREPQNERIDIQAQLDQIMCESDARLTCIVDLRFELFDDGDYIWDGVHFTQQGHDVVAALVVPEPSTGLLTGAGVLTLALLRRKRQWRS